MTNMLTLSLPGTLGNIAGAGTDGVLIGRITPTAMSKALINTQVATSSYCITDDGGLYVNETTPWNEATANDVEVLPTTPADDDAVLIGNATGKFKSVMMNLTTDGVGTWDIVWQYWDGSAWSALAGVSDGTSGFVAGSTGWKELSFTVPTDWELTEIDYVTGYWIRGIVDNYSAVTTPPQVGQGYVIADDGSTSWTDDTTDMNDAGAGDVALCHASFPQADDAFYFGYSEAFCKLKLTLSQAFAGTWDIAWEYWDGSAWSALSEVDDDTESAGSAFKAGTSTYLVHWQMPIAWAENTTANGPNGEAGYFVRSRISSLTTFTTQPLATQGWVLPISTGASGVAVEAATWTQASFNGLTASGTTADSRFMLLNKTTGDWVNLVWTKGSATIRAGTSLTTLDGDEILLVQFAEDGSTEYADGQLLLRAT